MLIKPINWICSCHSSLFLFSYLHKFFPLLVVCGSLFGYLSQILNFHFHNWMIPSAYLSIRPDWMQISILFPIFFVTSSTSSTSCFSCRQPCSFASCYCCCCYCCCCAQFRHNKKHATESKWKCCLGATCQFVFLHVYLLAFH